MTSAASAALLAANATSAVVPSNRLFIARPSSQVENDTTQTDRGCCPRATGDKNPQPNQLSAVFKRRLGPVTRALPPLTWPERRIRRVGRSDPEVARFDLLVG